MKIFVLSFQTYFFIAKKRNVQNHAFFLINKRTNNLQYVPKIAIIRENKLKYYAMN